MVNDMNKGSKAPSPDKATILLALGSNRPHGRHGRPRAVLAAAIAALDEMGFSVLASSPIMETQPVGPGQRRYANAVISVAAPDDVAPPELLLRLKAVERAFGRGRGRRWGDRVLDIDILAIADRTWPHRLHWRQAKRLAVPHKALASRSFVLDPLLTVAPDWRHPIHGRTTRQLRARLMKPHPYD